MKRNEKFDYNKVESFPLSQPFSLKRKTNKTYFAESPGK